MASLGGTKNSHRLLSAAASVNATNVKASEARLEAITGQNARASVVWLKLYDKATTPSEADTPKMTLAIPASSAFNFNWVRGVSFPLGLGYRMTTAAADNSTAALTAADIIGMNVLYA